MFEICLLSAYSCNRGKILTFISSCLFLFNFLNFRAKTFGDTADECGEAFFWCGKALLDLAR